MALFTNDKELTDQLEATKAEVTELEALVHTREAEIKNMAEQMAEISVGLETRTAELEESNAACALLEAEKSTIAAELEESKEAQAEFDSKVAEAAAAQMAELGVKEPVENIDSDDDTSMSRAQFNKLSPAEKSSFAIGGGRIK